MFRALQNDEGHALSHNFRPIQPLGDRIVLYNIGQDFLDLDNDLKTEENTEHMPVVAENITQIASSEDMIDRAAKNLDVFKNEKENEITTFSPSTKNSKKSHSCRNLPIFSTVMLSILFNKINLNVLFKFIMDSF
jgi:hypothetical protein